MCKRPIVIEFFGLPGAGKTTLSKRLTELLRERGATVDNPSNDMDHIPAGLRRIIRKLHFVIRELSHHPASSLRAALTISGHRQGSTKGLIKVLVNWWFVADLLRTRDGSAHFRILDQGICQALWSIGLTGKAGNLLAHCDNLIFESIPFPHVVVLVEANIETVVERLTKREGRNSRIEQVPMQEQRQLLLHGLLLYQRIVQEILPSFTSLQQDRKSVV